MADEGDAPAASGREKNFRQMLAEIREQLGQVEWVEQEAFWTARVWFGERDYARIKVVRASLVTDAMIQLAKLDDSRRARLREIRTAGEAVDGVAELLASEQTAGLWPLVADIFFCAVTDLHLPEWQEISDEHHLLYLANVAAPERTDFVKGLPIVLVARVLIGCVVQAGNLLSRLSRG